MSLSLSILGQLLIATTIATSLTTLGMMPRFVRDSRLQSLILMLLALLAGEVTTWALQAPHGWLVPAVTLLPLAALLGGRNSSWMPWARVSGACIVQNALVFLLYFACAACSPQSMLGYIISAVLWVAQAASIIVTLPLAFDILNVLGRRRFPGRDRMLTAPEPAYWPAVCFQVPAYNEPPELLAEIIKQLMRQDYPGRWMIQVIDNNTPDPRTWLPIRDLCKLLSDRVQFMHLENWPGYKAGALNEGTRRLPSWVELIAVIDADYLVDPHFLRATARHFADPQVAFVQTPQHYREWQGAPYFEGLFRMYESFFATFMTSRRENNGIIFAGTMGLVRRSALEEVGLWDAESITEDAELSVRLLGRGWYGIYDHRCYGGGLMPFDFGSLKRQRFRWAFGTIHLLKKHWRPLLGLRSREGYHLSLRQRLCFFGLGLQYFIEVVSFMFALLLLINVLAPFAGWNVSLPVFKAAMIVPLLLTTSGFVRTIWALREATRCKLSQAVGAFIFFFALSWVTARACVSALFRRRGVFLRTPKVREGQKWQSALRMTTQEIFLAASFICVALFTCYQHRVSTFSLMLLGLQAFIYGSAALCALAAEGIWLLPTWLLGTTGGAETALADGIMTEASQIYAAAQAPHLQLSRRIFTSQLHEAAKQDAEDVRSRLTRKRERMALRQYRRLYGRKFVTELHGF